MQQMHRSDWGRERRLDYIDWRLLTFGELRRENLIAVFGISLAQASADISRFIGRHQGAMKYDGSDKRYVPVEKIYRSRRRMDDPNIRRALTLLANAGHEMGWSE